MPSDITSRLSAAEVGGRELDAEIHASLGNCLHPFDQWKKWEIEDGNDYDSGITCGVCKKEITGKTEIPRYTTSIDAARSLAEDGVEFSTTNIYCVATVEVGLNLSDDLRDQIGGTITVRRKDGNLILAECEAWLRLRTALRASGGEEEG